MNNKFKTSDEAFMFVEYGQNMIYS